MMQHIVRSAASAALLSAALAVVTWPQLAGAQSGSAGGSIGNEEKSLSGTRSTPRTVESAKPSRRSKPEAEQPRRSARKSGGGGGGSFDGAWAVSSVGTPCGSASEAIVITSGRIVGQYTSGQVAPSGATNGAGSANGVSWTSSGRFSARSGSGSFRRSDGCVGRWTASKQ
jgi:hypothetical protein